MGSRLSEDLHAAKDDNTRLHGEIVRLRAEVAALQARLAEYERAEPARVRAAELPPLPLPYHSDGTAGVMVVEDDGGDCGDGDNGEQDCGDAAGGPGRGY